MKKSIIHNKAIYSWIALVLVVVGDCFAVLGRRDWNYWRYWVAADLILLLILGVIGWLNNTKFKFRTLILTKLLANATGFELLNVLYLIVFAINFAGIGNAILPLFQPNIDLVEAFYPLLVCGVVLLGLILFFPGVRKEKNDDAEYVFVSGISFINRFDRDQEYDSFKLNLVPLVRMIQKSWDPNKKQNRNFQFLIVLSDAFKDFDETVNTTLRNVMHVVCPDKENEIEISKGIEDNLRLLIREVAKREFPLLKEQIDSMKIEFTPACNYNGDFDIVYKRLDEKASPLDDADHILCFNLTPGTGIIGSLMTLQAIDGDRELYYYSQRSLPEDIKNNPPAIEEFKMGLLKKANKSQIPLKNILSQALESELNKTEKE